MSVVILGDGLLGSEIARQTQWPVVSRRRDGFDINNVADYDRYLSKATTVVNCIANTNTYKQGDHFATNYKSVMSLADYCIQGSKKLVHISTGYVYACNVNMPTEGDMPIPLPTQYTYTKLLADEYIKARMVDYLIVRSVHKPKPFPYEKAYIDHYGNFSYVDEVAWFILNAVQDSLTGVYNVGQTTLSMYKFASQTTTVLPTTRPDNFPKNIKYDCTKYQTYINEKNSLSQ